MHKHQTGWSRRGLVKGAAAAGLAVVPAAGTAAAQADPNPLRRDRVGRGPVLATVAATLVRADHDDAAPGALAVGVRVSLRAPAVAEDNLVLVVDRVEAAAEPAELNRQIVYGLRRRVAALLAERGQATDPEAIAVRLFGGAL